MIYIVQIDDTLFVRTKEKPLFCAKDVCRLLTVHTDSWRYLEENQRVRLISITNGGPQKMVFVTESGLYMLIMKSDKHKFINYKNIINKFYSLSFTCCHIC